MWDFVVPADEIHEQSGAKDPVAFRPHKMGLGCSPEMIQNKISENAKKSRLEKLLKRKGGQSDGLTESARTIQYQNESDSEFSKSKVASKVVSSTKMALVEKPMTKNQKKRSKQKMKQMQKQLLA